MITVKSSIIVTEAWGLTQSEFQLALDALKANGTIYDMTTKFDNTDFYLRGEGRYSVTSKVIPVPTVTGSYIVTNPTGTYKQQFPSWDSAAMPNGWIARGTTITAIALLENQDEKWLLLEKNAGYVNLSRVSPV
jgi:lipopolysaccharide export system protein LptC